MRLPSSGLETHPDGTGNINGIICGDWFIVNEWFNVASGLTISQAGTAAAASANVFLASHVGATIRYANGTTATISAYVDAQNVTVSPSQTVASQAFELYKSSQTFSTALARGLLKKVEFVSGDDGLIVQWDNSLARLKLASRPGYGVAANRILVGGGGAADLTSSANLTFNGTLLDVTGQIHSTAVQYGDITAVAASTISTSLDFALGNIFNVTLTSNTTIDATNIKTGGRYVVVVRQGGSGGFTLAFAAKFALVNGAAVSIVSAQVTGTIGVFYITAMSGSELLTTT